LNKNIKAIENFKNKKKSSTVREKNKMMKRLAPALAVLLIVAGISAAVLLRLQTSPGISISE